MIVDKKTITMTQAEWDEFSQITQAPYRPRTMAEFNAMCDLAAARAEYENPEMGFMKVIACEEMKFGPAGEVNFPINRQKLDVLKDTGQWVSDDEVAQMRDAGPTDSAAESTQSDASHKLKIVK